MLGCRRSTAARDPTMPLDPSDLLDKTSDLAREASDTVNYESGRNIQRLTRYSGFYRRINSTSRFGNFLSRLLNAQEAGRIGGLLILPAILWGFITRPFRRKPTE